MRCTAIVFFLSCTASAFSQNISGVVNIYRKVLWVDSAKGAVKLSDVSGFASFSGRKAMIIQMKGASMNGGSTSSDASFGNINAINNTGYYELGTICGFLNDTMVFERKLNNFYDVSGAVQCVILPKYTGNVTVTDTLRAAPWDNVADTGGVLAIEVPGTLILNKPVSAAGAGFKGGTYTQFGSTCNFNPLAPPTDYYMNYQADNIKTAGYKGEGIAAYITSKEYARGNQVNGGGGGNNHNAGGGGGSNYNSGGVGGERINASLGQCKSNGAGRGGLALSSYGYALSPSTQNRLFMGGGGGAGHDNDGFGMPGGHGGGIILIIANSIQGNAATASDNKIMANGAQPLRYLAAPYNSWQSGSSSDGSGGGGGGGVVVLKVNSFTGNTVTIEAKGANGGNSEIGGNAQCSGPGGGGGGGVVWFSAASLPAGTSTSVSGGSAGIVQFSASACNGSTNGAAAGNNGNAQFNFAWAALKDSSPVCRALVPLDMFVGLNGKLQNSRRVLTVSVTDKGNVYKCYLQRSLMQGSFNDISEQAGNNSLQYVFSDDDHTAAVYRARIINMNGFTHYSNSIRFSNAGNPKKLLMEIYPNPAKHQLTMQLYAPASMNAHISITDACGRKLHESERFISSGSSSLSFPVDGLPAGLLFIRLTGDSHLIVKPFIHQP